MGNAFHTRFTDYDSWFGENPNLFRSELNLLAEVLGPNPGRVLSVGCGSGLFEAELKAARGIEIRHGIEPSEGMARAAEARGLSVTVGTAEEADMGNEVWDTILFNGCPGYISDLKAAFENARKGLKPGGRLVVLDVPKESPFGLFYNLAAAVGSYDHPLVAETGPKQPYPIEFVKEARWRTNREKRDLMEALGFTDLKTFQTLTTHPVRSEDRVETPIPGSDKGSYVALIGEKEESRG